MKNLALILLTALGLVSVTAQAHTALSASKPANEEVVTVPLNEIVLTFSTEVRLIALSLQDGAGDDIDLGALPGDAEQEFAMATPELTPGNYIVSWRAVGADTHVVSGEFRFVVSQAA
jgi:methionine-rich copper-binding protein CopC